MPDPAKAVIQVVGYKNSGKTTTVCELIRRLSADGYKVGSVKSDAHHFEVDYPGKDSWLHREAGAVAVAIASQEKTAIMEQRPTRLPELIDRLLGVDAVVVEGYKLERYPKVVMVRSEADLELLRQSTNVIAVSSWYPLQHAAAPVVDKGGFDQLYQIVKQSLLNQWHAQGATHSTSGGKG